MGSVTATIVEKLQVLSIDKQQQVLALVERLEQEDWNEIYQGRFIELQQEIKIGMEDSARGAVISGDAMFSQLHAKLQQRNTTLQE